MKLFTTAALALLLTSGVAFAQTDGGNDGNAGADGGAASDGGGNADGGGNYLTGDGPGQFYTDKSMGTMKPEADVKVAWDAMSAEERENAKKSCAGNKDTKWTAFCTSIDAM